MNIVIGSGPAGVSVAMALIARGQSVTMLDGGERLSTELEQRRAEFSSQSPSSWNNAQRSAWQEPQLSATGDLAMRYGSTHAQVRHDATFDAPEMFAGRASHAIGGLSNVWGAAVLPYRQEDIQAWPITANELASHYQAVADFMPVSGTPGGDLQDLFPAFDASKLNPITSGVQATALLDRLSRHHAEFATAGIRYGAARQAVRGDCHLCGQCLHGCPWSMIYAAHQTLSELKKSERFSYRPGAVVTRISARDDQSEVHLSDGSTLTASKLFVAAGVYETARLVLNSLPGDAPPLTMQDSRQFFLPMLQRWSSGADPARHPLHTLAKVFVEIDDADVSPFLTHSQIYTWNEFYAREMMANYGRGIALLSSLFKAVSKRLIVAQTFIHSDHCDRVELHLDGKTQKLKPTIIPNPDMSATVDRASKALARAMSKAGLRPLEFATRLEGPAASFHTGGTLPMSDTPGALQTDTLGRLSGFENVHIVDASILPSIPASTITFSVMANAHRIGTLA